MYNYGRIQGQGGATGALTAAETWLAPEVPLSCHSSFDALQMSKCHKL